MKKNSRQREATWNNMKLCLVLQKQTEFFFGFFILFFKNVNWFMDDCFSPSLFILYSSRL